MERDSDAAAWNHRLQEAVGQIPDMYVNEVPPTIGSFLGEIDRIDNCTARRCSDRMETVLQVFMIMFVLASFVRLFILTP